MVVLGIEVGGRWSEEAFDFIRQLSIARVRAAPRVLRVAMQSSWRSWFNRCADLLAVTAQTSFAATLLDLSVDGTACDGDMPLVSEVLASDRHEATEDFSCLPAR